MEEDRNVSFWFEVMSNEGNDYCDECGDPVSSFGNLRITIRVEEIDGDTITYFNLCRECKEELFLTELGFLEDEDHEELQSLNPKQNKFGIFTHVRSPSSH